MRADHDQERVPSKTAEISRAIVKLHVEHFGRGPAKAKTTWTGEHIVCELDDIFTAAERTLISAGRFDSVRETRLALEDALEPIVRAEIERITGRPVLAFFSQVRAEPPMGIEAFILEAEDPA